MSTNAITRIEKLRGHRLSEEGAARLREVGDALNLRDDDAVWSLLAAMEYQRAFYEALPDKIVGASAEILQGISVAAEKETTAAQAKLADSVVEQAKRLSTKINYATLLPMGIVALICLLAYGSLLLWTGFRIGSGQAHDLSWILRMPSGFLMAGLCLAGGLFYGFVAAKSFVGEEKGWYRSTLTATAFLITGCVIFSFAI